MGFEIFLLVFPNKVTIKRFKLNSCLVKQDYNLNSNLTVDG